MLLKMLWQRSLRELERGHFGMKMLEVKLISWDLLKDLLLEEAYVLEGSRSLDLLVLAAPTNMKLSR